MTAFLEKAWPQAKQSPAADQDAVAARFLQTLADFDAPREEFPR